MSKTDLRVGLGALGICFLLILYALWMQRRNQRILSLKINPKDYDAFKDVPYSGFYFARSDFSLANHMTQRKDRAGKLEIYDQHRRALGVLSFFNLFKSTIEAGGESIECDFDLQDGTSFLKHLRYYTAADNKTVMEITSSSDFAGTEFEFELHGRRLKLLSAHGFTQKTYDVFEGERRIGRISTVSLSQFLLAAFSEPVDDLTVCFIFNVFGRMGR